MSLYPKKLLCVFQTCFHSKVNGKTEVCEHTGEFFFDDLGEDAVTVTKDDESNRLKNFVELKRCAHDSVKNRRLDTNPRTMKKKEIFASKS